MDIDDFLDQIISADAVPLDGLMEGAVLPSLSLIPCPCRARSKPCKAWWTFGDCIRRVHSSMSWHQSASPL
jgi:hypothetical protein